MSNFVNGVGSFLIVSQKDNNKQISRFYAKSAVCKKCLGSSKFSCGLFQILLEIDQIVFKEVKVLVDNKRAKSNNIL